MIFAVGVNSILAWGPWLDGSVFMLSFITMSALLFDNRTDIASIVISVTVIAIIGTLEQLGAYKLTSAPLYNITSTTVLDWFAYTGDFLILGVALIFAVNQFKREFANIVIKMQEAFGEAVKDHAQLEDRVRERTEELEQRTAQMRSSTIVARSVAEIQNISELMDAVTTLTSEQFGYYHIGLYLLDENKKTAFLQASSSQAGKSLIGQGFHIEPSRRNPLYLVVDQNRHHISSDIDNTQFFKDPNFPLTRSRMILPLAIRGTVMGMLDLHSEQPQSFTAQDAEIIQTLADLAAISIDNVRLINEARSLVSQLEASTSLQARETWSKLTSRHTPAYIYTPAGIRPIFSPKKNTQEGIESLVIPLTLHGQSIGAIKLRRKGAAASWSERERNLVEKIAAQVSLALENSRLVDEAQKNALRDQMITNVSSRVRETLDIESVIRTATTELRKVFDLKEAEISVGFPQSDKTSANPLRLK
jgi:GAF domain-containing protein